MPSLPRPALATAAVALSLSGASADWRTDIGYDRLAAELGPALPDGSGVPVTLVEAESADNYLPEASTSQVPGSGPIAGTGNFTGITFTDKTITPDDQSTGRSGHAAEVGGYFFGNATSIAPGITAVDCYNANDWVDNAALRTGSTSAPKTELSEVQNHSWIGSTDDDASDDELLERLDFLIERDRVIACVGLNNGVGTAVPPLLAAAFNTISVGKTNGGHSTGTTPAGVSTPGRTRPDIVAPANFTSHSTPMVASAAALLVSSPGGGSRAPVVYKAILLAGATKYQIPGWTSTPSQPLDPHFGAGQLDIYHSYHILEAGEQNSSSSTNRPSTGWDRTSSLTPGSPNDYFFEIPAGETASEFSAVLTWNRTITDIGPGPLFIASESLHDLTLTLEKTDGAFTPVTTVASSDSAIDNVEHIYAQDLGPGQYRLSVGGDSSKEYAVAWRTTLAPELTLASTSIGVGESDATATFTVTLDQPTLLPVTLGLTTTTGSAGSGDFTALDAATFTIPVGTTTLDVPIAITADDIHETGESFTVTVSAVQNATLAGPATATVTINDDDPQPTLALTAPEPTLESSPSLDFTLTLSNPSHLDVTVDATTATGTATAGDFTALDAAPFTVPAGATSATVPVAIVDDDTHEPGETVTLILTNPQNTTLLNTSAEATIADDDGMPALTLTPPDPTPETAASLTFTLTLSHPSYLDTTATFTTSDASAASGSDYTATAGTATIPAGTLGTTVTVDLLDDAEPEPDQAFGLDLSEIENATPDTLSATATLLDDDFPVVLQSLSSTPGPTSTGLTWAAVPGRIYRIETSTDLLTWTTATTLTATANPTTVPLPNTTPGRFFRILDATHP